VPRTFLSVIWQSFIRIHGVVVTLIGVALSIVVWLVKPDATVPVAILVPIAVLVAIVLVVLLDAGHSAWLIRSPGLPRVLYATAAVPGIPHAQLVCLLEPSDTFSYGVQVGFYYQNPDGFELLVGIGRVVNIQDDKRVQVCLTRSVPGQENNVNLISQNTKNVLERVRVKPSVPHDVFGGIDEERANEH
jgi:hypothetical protein